MRQKHSSLTILIAMLALLGFFHPAKAAEVEVSLGGQKKTIWTYPHKPYFSLGTLEELKEHYQMVKPFLPPMPFRMEGKWVIPGPNDTFRTFPDDPRSAEIFSPDGSYVVLLDSELQGEYAVTKRLRLMTNGGDVLWEKNGGPLHVVVTNDGYIIGQLSDNHAGSTVIYDRAGQIVKALEVFTPRADNKFALTNMRLIPQERLALIWRDRELVAVSYTGEILWRYTVAIEENDQFVSITNPNIDPLKRGIYVPIQSYKTSTIKILSSKNGSVEGMVWQNQPFTIPRVFSPEGKYAGLPNWDSIGLVDWRNGQMLFLKSTAADGIEYSIGYGDSSSVSDNPPLYAAHLVNGDTVLDADGRKVWSVNVSKLGYHKTVLSGDGQTLALLAMKTNSGILQELTGILLYKITKG